MFLAWSLILTGVNYARKRRLEYLLLKFFHASVDNPLTLLCRRRNVHIIDQLQKKRGFSSKCSLYKTPSAPLISQNHRLSFWDADEEILYRNENEEVVVKCGKIILQNSEWKFHARITSFDQSEHIFFIVQVSEQEFVSVEWNGHRQSIDDSARSIAQHKKNSSLFLYETSFNNFQSIVFNWSERDLFKDSTAVEELYSIESESLLANEKVYSSLPASTSNYSIESHTMPAYTQFAGSSDLQSTCHPDAFGEMSLSRCSFRSHTSSHSNFSETSVSIFTKNEVKQQPYSLLEALYFKELLGEFPSDDDILCRNNSNSLRLPVTKQCSTRADNKSETCLTQYVDYTPSHSSQSKVTKENKEIRSTRNVRGRHTLGGHSRSMSPSTKSVFTIKAAESSGMEWESSTHSSLVLPNYFRKLRQESCSAHFNTQSSQPTNPEIDTRKDVDARGGEVSPTTTLNDVSDCLLLDSKASRHLEEVLHDNISAQNSPSAVAARREITPTTGRGEERREGMMMASLLHLTAANHLIEEDKPSSSMTMSDDNNRVAAEAAQHNCTSLVAMTAATDDSMGMSLTQINDDKPSCSFAVNIKSTLPILIKRKLAAKRFNSLQQSEQLDYLFYAPSHNHSMQSNNSNIDTDHAASNRVKERQLSVSSVSGRSVSPLTLSLLANYGSREMVDPLLNANAAQPDAFLFSRRASFRNHRRFHSTEPRRQSTLCLSDSGYKSILKSSLNSPKLPERMHSAFETANRPSKPPYILVYTGDENELFHRISSSLKGILPLDTFTVKHLSTNFLINYPWFDENCTCLLISNTRHLDDQAWSRLQAYFVNSGKILFVCQNKLLANLTNCRTLKKQTSVLRNAFGKKSTSSALGKDMQKDFEVFMKKALKKMDAEKEVNEDFHAKDMVGGYRFSVVLFKKIGQPLLLYMQNGEHKTQSNALFSDATTEQLLTSSLLVEALCRLGIEIMERAKPCNTPTSLTPGYLVCQKDRLLLHLKGLTYGKLVGNEPKLFFVNPRSKENTEEVLPAADSKVLTIETRLRKTKIEEFESDKYFDRLNTKSLGRVLVYVPVCETTLAISKSLSRTFPTYDGILVVAGYQTKSQSGSGKEYLSPKGCASFTFNFVIPADSCLGQSISFIQHITAVAIVDAISKLVDDENFPLQIKWPDDLYFERKYKIGGVSVKSLLKNSHYECTIGGSINVTNTKPTMCLNDMLPSDCDKTLTVEEVLAEIMNKFECYVSTFVHRGKNTFLRRYYELWMHSREEVSILHKHNNCKEKVVIRGLDDRGFLEVRSKRTGQIFSVRNDGSSFDMMRGLIHPNQ